MIILEGKKWVNTKSDAKRGKGGWKNLSTDSTLIMQWLSMDGCPKIRPRFCVTSFITTSIQNSQKLLLSSRFSHDVHMHTWQHIHSPCEIISSAGKMHDGSGSEAENCSPIASDQR